MGFACVHFDLSGGSSTSRNPPALSLKGRPSQYFFPNTSCTLCGLSDCAIMAEALEGSSATLLLLAAGPHGLVAPCAWPLATDDDMVSGSARSETARCSLWRHGARRDGGHCHCACCTQGLSSRCGGVGALRSMRPAAAIPCGAPRGRREWPMVRRCGGHGLCGSLLCV